MDSIITMDLLAGLTIISGVLSLVCLLSLHFVSPEFNPSWRMISEYAFAFLLGVPFLPVAALIISYNLITLEGWNVNSTLILFAAHATWISLILMAVAMIKMMSGFKKAGIELGPNVEPPSVVPDGVVALNGYTNRILVLAYIYWLIVIAYSYPGM